MRTTRSLAPFAVLALALACTACGTTRSNGIVDPFMAATDETPEPSFGRDPTGERAASKRVEPERSPTGRGETGAGTIEPVAFQPVEPPAPVEPAAGAPVFTPAVPRDPGILSGRVPLPPVLGPAFPVITPPGLAAVPRVEAEAHPLAASAHLHPDEYLCDGGDRDHPVHYDAYNRLGLDTEDTVAEFLDEDGQRYMQPTNRVCVYAPRFGAVRTIESPGLEELVLEPGRRTTRLTGAAINTRLLSATHTKNDAGVEVRMRSRPSELDTEVGRGVVDQATRVAVHDKLINLYENIDYLQTGILEAEQRPLLAKRMLAAVAWEGDVPPVAHVQIEGAHQTIVLLQAAEIVGLEETILPANLRIVKLADKDAALCGEIVTFTIRYDNLGDEPVHYLKIVDNLTPRLEYVDDSADSDRVGRLVVQENGEGSLVLIFELGEPIEGHSGGVVSFEARVR